MGKESDLYDPYNTKTLGGDLRLDVDTYEKIQDSIHLESVNRKLLELTDLIGRVTNNRSNSGPIPMSAKFVTATVTDTNKATLFRPEIGEVWQLMGIGAVASGGSGTRTYAAYIYDGTTELNWLAVSSSGGNLTFTGEGEYPDAPFYFDYNMYCRVQSTGSFDSIQYNLAVIRVR